MTNFCPVSASVDRHLHEEAAEEARLDLITEIKEDLLAREYAPFDPDNIREALGNEHIDEIAECLHIGHPAQAGSLIWKLTDNYWRKRAYDEAVRRADTIIFMSKGRCEP